KKLTYKSPRISIPRSVEQRRLHKAILRYHDPANWDVIREALLKMRKDHLIGSNAGALIPATNPATNPANTGSAKSPGSNSSKTKRGTAQKAFGDKSESARKH